MAEPTRDGFGPSPPAREHHRNPTSRRAVTTYNNFYELGTDKSDPAENIHRLKPSPWTLRSRAW